ncbi:MAG TPA: hypothetical protein VK741_30435 [Acetobacteraceae bacterium]|jgi:hypothetical protein|nr:hypothetical protein [Acetobacteraceae bacterium]
MTAMQRTAAWLVALPGFTDGSDLLTWFAGSNPAMTLHASR